MTKSETRHQRIDRLIREGACGLLPTDWSAPCPKRGGPEKPDGRHPAMVGFLTCSGCPHNDGLWYFEQVVCTHPGARQVASRLLAEALRHWEESQTLKAQPALF